MSPTKGDREKKSNDLKVKRTWETKRNSERAINSKLSDLIKVKQSPIYTNVDENGVLTWAGHSRLSRWLVETHGLEIKKKAKQFAREGVFMLAGSSDLQPEEVTANNCGLPLLQYSLEDDIMRLYKVLQKQYSSMITALKIKYGSPDIPPWIPEELHDF